jgi:hypothetical protein
MGQNRIPESKTGRNREVDFISDLARLRCIPILMATPEERQFVPAVVRLTLHARAGGPCCETDYTG